METLLECAFKRGPGLDSETPRAGNIRELANICSVTNNCSEILGADDLRISLETCQTEIVLRGVVNVASCRLQESSCTSYLMYFI